MSQKVIWGVVVVIVIAGLLWYAGIIPGVNTPAGSQGAAAANANPAPGTTINAGAAPSAGVAVTLAQKASADLRSAGSNTAKVSAAATESAGAIAALATLLPQMQLAVNVSSNKGNNLDAVGVALQDYAKRISMLNSVSVNVSSAVTVAAGLDAIVSDISAVNTALQAAKYK